MEHLLDEVPAKSALKRIKTLTTSKAFVLQLPTSFVIVKICTNALFCVNQLWPKISSACNRAFKVLKDLKYDLNASGKRRLSNTRQQKISKLEDNDGWDPIDEPLSSTVHKTELKNKKSTDGWDNENWLDTQLRPNNKADSGNSSWRTKNIQSRDRAKTEQYNNQDFCRN
uniref:Uncharacterized protein n=1 Tax=Tetranychus urticae TaxID=32264 RepID=T1JVR3_TETUR